MLTMDLGRGRAAASPAQPGSPARPVKTGGFAVSRSSSQRHSEPTLQSGTFFGSDAAARVPHNPVRRSSTSVQGLRRPSVTPAEVAMMNWHAEHHLPLDVRAELPAPRAQAALSVRGRPGPARCFPRFPCSRAVRLPMALPRCCKLKRAQQIRYW